MSGIVKKINENEVDYIYNNFMVKDFPKAELKPLERIKYTMSTGMCEVLALYDWENIKSYAVLIIPQNGEYVLLDYFAVVKNYRGTGIGHEMLGKIMKYIDRHKKHINGMFIECESPEYATSEYERIERERRIKFYKTCGCNETGFGSELFRVNYDILNINTDENYEEINLKDLELIYRQMFKKEHFENKVKYWINR